MSRSSSDTDMEKNSDVYGVVGICGVVGNMLVRMLVDKQCHVMGTDMMKKRGL